MSNKCKTERITYYRAIVNERGSEKGDVDSIEEDWYDSNGNIYKSVSKFCNGLVEGLNNKIKAIKRSMYGRASDRLLWIKMYQTALST